MNGTIKRLFKDKGFGFVRAEDGREIFFHRSAVFDTEFESLTEGQAVEFDVEKGQKGPRAMNLHLKED